MWDTINMTDMSLDFSTELIHVPYQNYLQICLVNTGLGMPFISAIELRPLDSTMYVSNFGSLAAFTRLDVGSGTPYR